MHIARPGPPLPVWPSASRSDIAHSPKPLSRPRRAKPVSAIRRPTPQRRPQKRPVPLRSHCPPKPIAFLASSRTSRTWPGHRHRRAPATLSLPSSANGGWRPSSRRTMSTCRSQAIHVWRLQSGRRFHRALVEPRERSPATPRRVAFPQYRRSTRIAGVARRAARSSMPTTG